MTETHDHAAFPPAGRRRSPRWPTAAFVLLPLFAAGACSPGAAPRNLLLVLWDTTRADRLSCYGYEKPTTPHLDRLAAEGTRFEEVYAASSLTPVSAGTMLTGALPFRHGVRSLFVVGEQTLAPDVASLPEALRERGLATAAFVSAKPMGAHYGLGRGFETYHDDLSATKERHGAARFGDSPQRPGDETVDLALDWLRENGRRSFALMVHLFDAHDPSFVPPREFLEERLSYPLPSTLGRVGAHYRIFLDPAARSELYDAEIAFMDAQLQRLLDELERQRIAEQTLVVVVADHGESFGEHDFWTHGLLHEEQLRVPVVMRGPRIPEGRTVRSRGRLVDLYPTLADLFDLPLPKERLDGVSLVHLLDRDEEPPRTVYAEVHHSTEDSFGRESELYTLIDENWKYVHRPVSGAHELYDLGTDPGELENLFDEDHPQARRLAARLAAMGAVDSAVPDLDALSPEDLEELRSLGYL